MNATQRIRENTDKQLPEESSLRFTGFGPSSQRSDNLGNTFRSDSIVDKTINEDLQEREYSGDEIEYFDSLDQQI